MNNLEAQKCDPLCDQDLAQERADEACRLLQDGAHSMYAHSIESDSVISTEHRSRQSHASVTSAHLVPSRVTPPWLHAFGML